MGERAVFADVLTGVDGAVVFNDGNPQIDAGRCEAAVRASADPPGVEVVDT